jgi:hypothetical protein
MIRNRLRAKKVYPVVRNFDYEQENQEASDVIYEIVNLLVRDESVGGEAEEGRGAACAAADTETETSDGGTIVPSDKREEIREPQEAAADEDFGSNELDEVD